MTSTAEVSLAGGTENMSAVPFLVRNVRYGVNLGANIPFEDALTGSSLDTYCNFTMPQTAENLAEKYELKRGEVDEFALESQKKWKAGKIYILRSAANWLHILNNYSIYKTQILEESRRY